MKGPRFGDERAGSGRGGGAAIGGTGGGDGGAYFGALNTVLMRDAPRRPLAARTLGDPPPPDAFDDIRYPLRWALMGVA